jgi:hypothetical protein
MESISLGHGKDINVHGEGADSEGDTNVKSCGFHDERSNGDDMIDAK